MESDLTFSSVSVEGKQLRKIKNITKFYKLREEVIKFLIINLK